MYTKFGVVNSACEIFHQMPVRDLAAWNAMLSAFCRNASPVEALSVLQEMLLEGVRMDDATVSSVLSACAPINNLLLGRLIHVYTIKSGLACYVCVSNALISMYEKLSCIADAHQIFESMVHRDLVTWNAIITAYKQSNDPTTALSLLNGMKEVGIQFDVPILVSLASLVAQSGDVESARSVHGFVLRREWILEDNFSGSALVDMYAKLGKNDYAKYVFDGLTAKDVISWTALITGFAQNGLADEAIELFRTMAQCDEVVVDERAFVSVLPAISHVRALREGVTIHGRSVRLDLQSNMFLGTCLIDMYAKCGRIDEAVQIFEEIPGRNAVMWNAIISAHGINGKSDRAFVLFQEMQEEGVKPDQVTYVCLLSACSRAGLVDEGQNCFNMMLKNHGIEPSLKHYACMVDLLSRAGHLDAAFEFMRDMPLNPDANVWSSLLGACKIHGNAKVEGFVSDDLLQI
ncbi:pentatricopeptide repeat-containing protein At4g33990-like [Aristolochia californica]|uniref:pentatricopeptide repeat-containing protein At4g33990-like n=1 Tax=Aristolochia californica TaxID=171875 RepID=UPI0035E2254A